MRELTLRVESPEIIINGECYALHMDDLDLYTQADDLLKRCAALPQTGDGGTVLEAARAVTALLEAALGQGAIRQISGGKPVSLPLAIEWLGALAGEAAAHYTALALQED